MVREGEILWTPSDQCKADAVLTTYLHWLERNRGHRFPDYPSLYDWSVRDLRGFWASIWDFVDFKSPTPYTSVLDHHPMPAATWFSGARINYAEQLFRRARGHEPAIRYCSERRPLDTVTWNELYSQVAALATSLRNLGIKPGDRVVGYLPSTPEAVVALAATTAIGAVWSCCPPEFGVRSVLDRLQQLEPKAIIAVDGYRYGGRDYDRRADVRTIVEGLPSLEHRITWSYQFPGEPPFLPGAHNLDRLRRDDGATSAFQFEAVPFDHPLWVLFTSGTTGLPKGIVHGHGGVAIENLKTQLLHNDLRPTDTAFFYTTTGWIVFNGLIGSLLSGATVVLYDGHPAYPGIDSLWKLAQDARATGFGASPSFVGALVKAGVVPRDRFDLSALRSTVCTGAPMSPEIFEWFYRNVKADLWVTSTSGGTEVATGFVGASPYLPVRAGEMQCRCLGVDAQAWDESGKPVVDQVGELVITQPMPSMPIRFWNDPTGTRYRETYFEPWAGVWRHGDLFKLNQRGGSYIYGRSDSTLNRNGIRLGTSDYYRVVESMPGVRDSLVVNVDWPSGPSEIIVFLVLTEDAHFDAAFERQLRERIRSDCSPRYLPDRIIPVPAIPYTLTGKKMEVPVKRILLGTQPDLAASRDSMANPGALNPFVLLGTELSQLHRTDPVP